MDNATKRQLKKQDQFVSLTEQGVEWASHNRSSAIIAGLAVVGVILIIIAGFSFYQRRSNTAATALGAAMQTYEMPIANQAQPLPPGTKSFNSVSERAAAANKQFQDVASQYGMTNPGKIAEYFVGVTYMEQGQNASAEAALNKVADSWNSSLSALAKLALAQLYQQTGRTSQAVDIYNDLAKKNATTVPTGLAQIELAELYEAQGNTAKAHEIYAQIKDKDKDAKGQAGAAGEIAAEKLNPKAPAAASLGQ